MMMKTVLPFLSRCCGRKGLALRDEHLYDLVNDLAQLSKDQLFVVAMAATVHQLRRAPDETLILVGPFNNLYVA